MKHLPGTVHKRDRNELHRLFFIAGGVAVNVLLSFFADRIGLPLFLDTVGTIAVSAIGGVFPGIVTAVVTNTVCMLYNGNALYFAFINALVAIFTSWFVQKYTFREPAKTAGFIMVLALFCGVTSAFIQWGLLGGAQHNLVVENAEVFAENLGIPLFPAFLIVNILLNILDKGLATAVALILSTFMSPESIAVIKNSGWRQKPLSDEEIRSIKDWSKDVRFSLGTRMSLTLTGVSLLLIIAMGWIGLRLYFNNSREEKTENAWNAVKFAADIIDPDRISDYLKEGREAPGYAETEDMLFKIRKNASGVKFLYVLRIEEKGCRFIFDLPSDDGTEPYAPGDLVEFEEAFEPYLPALFAGEEIEPIESNGVWDWVLTVYYPVKDKSGSTVCYVGADVSLSYVADYTREFFLKMILILAGFFMLILAFGIWTTDIFTAYPISSMASCVDGFVLAGESQDKLDENVKKIRELDICTGDEVEKLYKALCKMTLNQTEQMRDIRHLSDSTAKMQDGLIITMADMVENRDSDTGAHIQKTAAYVKIIVDGLKRKGYYASKLTPKFISDVVRSAPLHDVGKINIPDGVLNKPGKLTDEEYEVMKTHSTAGKKIMENAISTIHGENYLKEARNMAAYHHERWDGKGYPEGLHGEVIPLSARIMAVADVFDALTSPRVYKPGFPLEKALAILEEGSGKQFDPKCVEVFMEALPEIKVILRKYNHEV